MVKLNQGEGLAPTAFESAELRVQFAIGNKKTGEFREWTMRKGELPGHASIMQLKSKGLSDTYKKWRRVWGLKELRPEPEEPEFLQEKEPESVQPQSTGHSEQPSHSAGLGQSPPPMEQQQEQQTPHQSSVESQHQQHADLERPQPATQLQQETQQQENNQSQASARAGSVAQRNERQNPQDGTHVRTALAQPAGLPHAKRAKSSTNYTKLVCVVATLSRQAIDAIVSLFAYN